MSSLAEHKEELERDLETGAVSIKPLKSVPLEFSKGAGERAKLTFYEVMSQNNNNNVNSSNASTSDSANQPQGLLHRKTINSGGSASINNRK